ncbi:MAG: type IX secretion system membrane protein PorP/SprF [Endomicrobia bacterium]|nr:type IX secretion system membrane protein PorP/SprF [Endomicrobiia bacterium]
MTKKVTYFVLSITFSICISYGFFRNTNPVDTSLGNNFLVSETLTMFSPVNVSNIDRANIYAVYNNPYNAEDLHYSGLYFTLAKKQHYLGLNLNLLSFSNVYYETLAGLCYANRIKNYVVGSKLKFYFTRISSDFDFITKELNVVDVDFGVSYETKKLLICLLLENILNSEYKFIDQEVSAQKLKFTPWIGIKYAFIDEVKFFLQKNLSEVDKTKLSSGIQGSFKEQFFLRAGVSENKLFSLGFGIALSRIVIDFSSTFSDLLGYNLIFGVGYKI